jgi:hypothetical protein
LLLRETAKHPVCFVAVERAIGLQLVPKDQLAKDDVGVPRRRHKIPSVVAEESAILLGHTSEYLLTEACRLSRSQGRTCMPEVLRVRCTGDTEESACAGEGVGEGAGEGADEGDG